MQHHLLILAVVATTTLTACGSKTDANEKNFGAALTQYFDKKGELCLDTRKWPVDISESDLRFQKDMLHSNLNRMAALEAAGLVKSQDIEVEGKSWDGKPNGRMFKMKRYELADAAKPYMKERDVKSIGLNGSTTVKQVDLCWGKKALDKIVKWEGPMSFGEYKEANVVYTYKIDDAAAWTRTPAVQAAFPAVKMLLDGAGSKESKHGVKLTSEGWESRGLD
ncbi:hypothetical protein [Pseudoduganella lutea]|uniref:Uncharacterized protein n=1 Tax=Pseudoduganella lutea TaxID=321985 RepID=A0A4P6L3P8_9BURK|nr:hypothetical protein [Pseudoduganella lutea]QBE65468.1 hypothetical protein EWM63_22785 [Pseudoduganella lutea]